MAAPTLQDLEEVRVWENDQSVVQTEKWGSEFRAVMFTKTSEGLHFVEIAFYKDADKLLKLLGILKLSPTKKYLVLKEKFQW